ncbi:MAG: hypothetical protein HYX69_05025 [Planctomycetia bacterium]|nr:hypothetical protein [Planctomycetia bacterium]
MQEPATDTSLAGTARLPVVVAATIVTIFYAAALDYSLPLFIGALSTATSATGGPLPADTWSVLWKYQQAMWIVGPFAAGLLARRYGECTVWGWSLIGAAMIPITLAVHPAPDVFRPLALWLGLTGALKWIAGVSLAQMVPNKKKGLSNGLMMASLGLGSIAGAIVCRGLLYRKELAAVADSSGLAACLPRLFSFTPMSSTPDSTDFAPIFWLLAASTVACGVVVRLWGQRLGRFQDAAPPDWQQSISDMRALARCGKFWALVLTLCVLGGPVFATANQFLPYRAEELGLKVGAEDHGWMWLQLLRTLMWIPGGAAVGFVAGKRAPGLAGVAMLATFSLTALSIGASQVAIQLFASVALFEFSRQFMRWSHSGYLAEHLPENLRAAAIGCSITFTGIGATVASWTADYLWSPIAAGFRSSTPFLAAALVGLTGSAILLVYDWFRPIRYTRPRTPPLEP